MTSTLEAQKKVENDFLEHVAQLGVVRLQTRSHVAYIKRGLFQLPASYTSLDASQPWIIYWTFHALQILKQNELMEEYTQSVVRSISRFQSVGFAGGFSQLPHMAPTYASVMALVTIGTKEAYELINKESLYKFLMRMKQPDGSFIMHSGGEVDIRGCYCALSVASILGILTDELKANVVQFIKRCQSYEGGFGSIPGAEAHGGYTFCAVATLHILNALDQIDTKLLLKWLTYKQLLVERGFQGRTNKLVDGCYGFWQVSVFYILNNTCFDVQGVRDYLLKYSQIYEGGFADRQDNNPDYYHTCYCLSGLSLVASEEFGLDKIDPVYNVSAQKLSLAKAWFK